MASSLGGAVQLCRETELHGKTASSLFPLNYLNSFMQDSASCEADSL